MRFERFDIARRATTSARGQSDRVLSLGQTLTISLVVAGLIGGVVALSGRSLLVAAVATFIALNATPLVLGVLLSLVARRS